MGMPMTTSLLWFMSSTLRRVHLCSFTRLTACHPRLPALLFFFYVARFRGAFCPPHPTRRDRACVPDLFCNATSLEGRGGTGNREVKRVLLWRVACVRKATVLHSVRVRVGDRRCSHTILFSASTLHRETCAPGSGWVWSGKRGTSPSPPRRTSPTSRLRPTAHQRTIGSTATQLVAMKPTNAGTDDNAHTASVFDLAELEKRLVVSLEAFLHAWAEGDRGGTAREVSSVTTEAAAAREDEQPHHAGAHPNPMLCANGIDAALHATARIESAPSMSTLANAYLATLPPCLPTPLPRSFRPHEMMPGVYLGSWSDIGTDIHDLARRLRRVSTVTHESSSCIAFRSWQRLVLLVRALPVKGMVAPRLELRATRRRQGARRPRLSTEMLSSAPSTKAAASGGPQQPSQRSLAMHSRLRPGAATTAVPADEDLLVAQMSLSEVYQRICAVVATTTADPVCDASVSCVEGKASGKSDGHGPSGSISDASSRSTSSDVNTVAKWLCPHSPLTLPSRSVSATSSAAADVPSSGTPAVWYMFLRAMQDVLVGEASAHAPAVAAMDHAQIAEAELRYWCLTLPIQDSPGTRLLHYTPMTSLILHAALALQAHPMGCTWLQGQQQRKMAGNNAAVNDGRSLVGVFNESVVACGRASACATETRVFPCVVVHCQAGKSRSVTFVAAFLMQEWMWWYRGCYPLHTAGADTITEEQQKEQRRWQGSVARRLVDTVLSHLRRRRLCIDINLGFDTQLWEMMCSFVQSLLTDMLRKEKHENV
ncbi:hypothetical protein, conserved [Leishmania tarentolae]|uniref:Tyrosine specific protein phosphatases domain-containing protein n=1 Tax=Leishmania tarentolae TaxID=5689 RepID=A0A640KWC1_LEITA|nr:hypothetical protein, conserved [Leishmania tarentolae]GET94030.1 hypothetical protein, conserved [Leishmania tarentolae]